jgi:hypothetical protein
MNAWEKAPPVVLIMGLGMQLVASPDGFCEELLKRGLQRVVRQPRCRGIVVGRTTYDTHHAKLSLISARPNCARPSGVARLTAPVRMRP